MLVTQRPHCFKYLFAKAYARIGELKYTDVDESVPKKDKYAWFYQDMRTWKVTFLTFVSATNTMRVFEEGKLEICKTGCVFTGKKQFEGTYDVC